MKFILAIVGLFLGTTCASYLKEGCVVVDELTTTVEFANSLQFLLRFPLDSVVEVHLPIQNKTFQMIPSSTEMTITRRGWLQVELFFYKKVEMKDCDGKVILEGTNMDDNDLKPPPQKIILKSPKFNILRNCPEGEPVWRIDKSREFPLKERNFFAIILQNYPVSFELTINQQVWNLTCDKIQSCSFNKTSPNSFMMSIIKDADHFEVLIDEGWFAKAPSDKIDFARFELKSGTFYIAEPKEQEEPEAAKDNESCKLLLIGLVAIAICFLVSFGLNAYYIYLQKEICGLCRSKQNEDTLYANTGNETKQMLAIQSEGNAGDGQPNPHYLRKEPYLPPRKTQNVNNSVQEVSRACKSCESPKTESSAVMPFTGDYSSLVQEGDYICPNEVKPLEVEIMIKENIIKGRVFPSEVIQDVKHVKQGEYISLTGLQQNSTYTEDDGEPDYINIPKRM